MRTLIKFILLFIFFGCSESKKKENQITDAETKSALIALDKMLLDNQGEEIALISAINEIHRDTIKNIISDYNSATVDGYINKVDYSKILDSLSIKHIKNRKEIAKIILEYKSLQTNSDE